MKERKTSAAITIWNDLLLSSPVIEFLCQIGGAVVPQETKDDSTFLAEGIVALTCPLFNTEGVNGNKKVSIFTRVPFLPIISSKNPARTAIEHLEKIIKDEGIEAAPAFFFIRRTMPSNTPKW